MSIVIIDRMIVTLSSGGCDTRWLWLVFVTIMHMRGVFLSDCPVLRSFTDNTGFLMFNKTMMREIGQPIHCQWLIASSRDQQINVEFDYIFIPISDREYLHSGCRRGSINLWTAGLKHEEIQICGDRQHTRLGGIGQVLMIELRVTDPRLDVNFLMRYQLAPVHHVLTTLPPTITHRPVEKNVHLEHSSYDQCGSTTMNGSHYYYGIASRIVGGQQAIPHSHPWQVLLNNRGKFCGASVLNSRWLITAAHCVNNTDSKQLLAEFGIHDRFRIELSREARTIKQIVVYPSYTGRAARWIHDIALLQLSEPLIFNPFVRSVCLPLIDDFGRVGDRTIVTGWGSTQNTGNLRYLREVDVPIQTSEECGLRGIRHETNICAGLCPNTTCDACQGDSGGPMVQFRHGRWHLVGLISWGFSCAGLGVYTKISYYSTWILQIIQQS